MDLKKLKKVCLDNNISFSALEKAVGIGNGVIAKWENSSPRVENLKKVADYFGCTVDDLLKEK